MTSGSFYGPISSAMRGASAKTFLNIPGGPRRTFGEIDALSARIAGALRAAGARPGDRVAAQVEKSAENVALYLGVLARGPRLSAAQHRLYAGRGRLFHPGRRAGGFICDPAHESVTPKGPKVLTLSADGGGSLIATGSGAFDAIEPRDADDLAAILYTSGTTGRSKGAMLTHQNLQSNAEALVSIWKIGAGDVLLHALPIFHIHGLFVALKHVAARRV